MVIPIISTIVGAVAGGAETAAAGSIGPAIGGAAETATTTAINTTLEIAPKLADPLAAKAIESTVPEVVNSSANALKGVEAVSKLPDEAVTSSVNPGELAEKIPSQTPQSLGGKGELKPNDQENSKTVAAKDAIYQEKLNRLNSLLLERKGLDAEIELLQKELGMAKGISPKMVAAITAALLATGAASELAQQVKKDTE